MAKLSDILGQGSFLQHQGGCRTCPRKRVDFVEATLRDAPLIFVGEAPGAEEVKLGEGFIGESGQLLRHMAEDAAIPAYSLGNVIHCRPPGNATPSGREISCCMRQFTMEEVRGYPVVVLVGNVATTAFFPGLDPGRLRGNFVVHPDYPGQRFYPMYHPAYILRNRRMEPVLRKMMDRLGDYLRDPSLPFTTYTPQSPKFDSLMKEALAAPAWSLDLETNRLESWHVDAHIRSIAVTWDGLRVLTVSEEDPMLLGFLHEVAKWLQDPTRRVIGFNLGFDLEWLEQELNFTVKTSRILDVKSLYYQLRSYKEMNLKELVSRELNGYRCLVPWPDKHADPETLMLYNAEDVVYPWQLFKTGFPQLHTKTRDLYIRVGGPSSLATRRIQATGIHFRAEAWQKAYKQVEEELEANLKAWHDDDPRFDPKKHISGNGFQEYLFDVCQLPILQKTRTGKPTVDDVVIDNLITDHGAWWLSHRKEHQRLDKLRSTYLEPFKKLVASDGRVHPSYLYDSTKTGRLSSRDPNFQNQPRNNLIRDMFGAALGRNFYQADYSQIELRTGVSLARSMPAIERYNAGIDIHRYTASVILGKGLLQVTKQERTLAKPVNFGLLYGGSAEGLVGYAKLEYGIDIPIEDAKKFVKLYFTEIIPGLSYWHQSVIQSLRENKGELMTDQGHTIYYKDWDSENGDARGHAERAAINATCQSTAAYMTTYTVYLTDQRYREGNMGSRVVGTVHDSIHLDVPEGEESDAINMVQGAVRDVATWCKDWFLVPLEIDIERGSPEPSWGQLVGL